jgi:hypothetical protein
MRGSCLCGQVTYHIKGEARSVVACHCTQCRKTSGHYVAATQCRSEDLAIDGQSNLAWYQSSASAKRGFCRTCGSQLFWTEFGSERTSVMAGTLDGKTGLTMDRQLFPESKGDYYALPAIVTAHQKTR